MTNLFVKLYIREDRMHAPRLAKHRPEAQGEPGHEDPSSGRADVRESLHAGQVRVEAQKDDRGVGQNATHDDKVIHVGRGHFDLPLIPEFDVNDEKAAGQDDPEGGDDHQDGVDLDVDPGVNHLNDGSIPRGPLAIPNHLAATLEV